MAERLVILLRHGRPARPLPEELMFLGQTDLPLSDEGIAQARLLGAHLRQTSLCRIYCSDLKRSRRTAEIIGEHQRQVVFSLEPALREIDLGAWDGLPFSEVRRAYPRDFRRRGRRPVSFRPPRGESFRDLQRRVVPCFHRVCEESEGNIAIVGHAGVNRVLLCSLLAIPLRRLFSLEQDFGCINLLAVRGRDFRLRALNLQPAICPPGSIPP